MKRYAFAIVMITLLLAIGFSYVAAADGGITLASGGRINFVDRGRLTGKGYLMQSSVGQFVSGQSAGAGYQVVSNPPIAEPPPANTGRTQIYLPVVLK